MSGQPKSGLDWAGWNVNIFDGDPKIDKLLDAQGLVGFGIYFYLCQMAYKFEGYFYRWSYDDSATTARRIGCGVGSKTIENVVGLCLQIGLFDKPLFDRHGILTSRGIQRRYCIAIQGRRAKSAISDYWLLDKEESKGLVMCAKNGENQPANSHVQAANSHVQAANAYKVKESKEYNYYYDALIPAFDFYEQNIGLVPSLVREEMVGYIQAQIEPGVIVEALKQSVSFGARNWKYADSILKSCLRDNVKTVKAFKAREVERNARHQRGGKPGTGEDKASPWSSKGIKL